MKEKILIASKNLDKVREIKKIFNGDLLSLHQMKEVRGIEETGDTFAENALIKAKYYYNCYHIPVIADDSGLVVPALNGQPGIFSARYGGENASAYENNMKLLAAMKKLKGDRREAFFICCAVYYNNNIHIEADGKIKGVITEEARGTNGFGYDPLFLLPDIGKTYAELDLLEKNKISHRYIAFNRLKDKLKNYHLSYE